MAASHQKVQGRSVYADRRPCVLVARTRCLRLIRQQRPCELVSDERLQVFHALAYADPVNRDRAHAVAACGDGSERAALGGAVEFGDDQARQVDGGVKGADLRQDVLAGVAVDHEQDFVRGGAVGFADDATDFFQLFHQVQLSGQAARGIDHDHASTACAAGVDGVVCHGGGVAALLGNDADVIAAAPFDQLLARGGAEGIACGQQDARALALEGMGQLADGGGFACAVDASDHDDERLGLLQVKGAFQRPQMIGQQGAQCGFDFGWVFDAFFAYAGAQCGQELFCGLQPGIGHDQRGLEFLEQVFVDFDADEQAAQALPGARQALFEAA